MKQLIERGQVMSNENEYDAMVGEQREREIRKAMIHIYNDLIMRPALFAGSQLIYLLAEIGNDTA